MIRDLIRIGGGKVVHAQESKGKALCDDRTYEAATASWEGDDSEVNCEDCRDRLGIPPRPQLPPR
ncbi:MAG TPA: hypothetical protein VK428_15675 [Acidimicrobiales bacterium]|nr:hypothetical protein [Acidimicrobiales bacterium]